MVTYTADSLILGTGTATAAQIERFFAWRGQALAPAFAPDRQYKPAPAGIGQMIIDAARLWSQAVVNHDLVAAQVVKEAAAWQSEYARHRNNPSGLGAINSDPDQAITFATPQEGLRATVAHLLTYTKGPGPWTRYDPRAAVTPGQWQGAVRVLRDLEQKWAFTPWDKYNATPENLRYGASVARMANELLAVEVTMPPAFPKPDMIPYPSPNKDGYNASEGMTTPRTIEAVVLHIATGTKQSNLNHLTNPNSGASCNAYVDKQGRIYEMVPAQSAAWTNGPVNKPDLSNPIIANWVAKGWNPNTRTYTVEHEGNPGDDLTEAQIASTSRIIAWRASVDRFPVDRTHVIGHYQIDSVNRSHCPSFSDAEWQRLIDGANALLSGAPRTRKVDGVGGAYDVSGAILTAYEALETIGAVWWTLGVPAGPEQGPVTIDDVERRVQPFDRSWLMTEGDGAVIPKPAQLVAIKRQLGIETGTDVRLDVLRGLLGTAKDSIDAAISEVAD